MKHEGMIAKVMHQMTTRGNLARNEKGSIGLVVRDEKVRMPGGGYGYVGVELLTGEPWFAKVPTILGTFSEFLNSGEKFWDWVATQEGR